MNKIADLIEPSAEDAALELRLLPGEKGRPLLEQRIHCARAHDTLSGHIKTCTDVQS
jgi:hypothetical protein